MHHSEYTIMVAEIRGVSLTIIALVIVLMEQTNAAEDETRVEMTTPLNSVIADEILVVQCRIWNAGVDYTVLIARSFEGGSERISSGDDILRSSVKERVFLAIRTFPDGSVVYFLTMIDVSERDRGEYACTVTTMKGTRVSEIGYDAIYIKVSSFPDDTQPSCTSNPQNLVFVEGSMLELTCTTYKTFPLVQLRWRLLSTYDYLQSSNLSKGENLFSNVYVLTNMEHNGAIFRCEMTSYGFPDRVRSCEIGPISVKSSLSNVDQDFRVTTLKPKEGIDFKSAKPTGDCQNICPSSSTTVFYLTVSTAVTCLLTIIFLITTVVMCCKYNSVSSRATQRHVPSPPSLASDPVYVSLQRRNTNERVYMTLEDPNNPEGKVLLPKEVFDEFYNRTLSLRKS